MFKVFVYGTLKPEEKNYPRYCQGKTIAEKPCWTKGELFALSVGYPAMTKGDDRVYGYLLTFASDAELINLDFLEGYTGIANSQKNKYDRLWITVYDRDDDSVVDECWAYFKTPSQIDRLNHQYLPNGHWTNQ